MVSLFFFSVVQQNVETAGNGNENLLEGFMGMSSPGGAARDIVQIVDPFNFKGNMPLALDKGQVPAWIVNLG
jgi:hypothetical protein